MYYFTGGVSAQCNKWHNYMNVSNHEESFGSKIERHLFEMSRGEKTHAVEHEEIVRIEILASTASIERST
jgi:hypothetical protein